MENKTKDDFITSLSWALQGQPRTHNNQSGALLIGDTPEIVTIAYDYIKKLIPLLNESNANYENFPIQKICDVEIPSIPKIRQMLLSFRIIILGIGIITIIYYSEM